jgi:GNAT superfamily N-acetyltransferase
MIKFVIADESHTREVAHLLAKLFEEVEHTPTEDELAEMFDSIEDDSQHSTLLALDDDDDVVGIITLTESISFYAGGRIGVVNELYVVPPYRSEGVGKMLLDAAKDLGQERGWKRLEVTTPGDDFQKTLHFYEREGFVKIGPRYKYEI